MNQQKNEFGCHVYEEGNWSQSVGQTDQANAEEQQNDLQKVEDEDYLLGLKDALFEGFSGIGVLAEDYERHQGGYLG